jgi:hypothetical protein
MAEPTQITGQSGHAETSVFERFGYFGEYNKVVHVSGVSEYNATGSNYGAKAFVVEDSTGVFLYPAAGGGPISGSLFNVTDLFTVNQIGLTKVDSTNAAGSVYVLYYK